MRKVIELRELTDLGITEEQLESFDILVLPESFDKRSAEMRDAQDSINLSKLLKASGVKCANSFDLGLDIPTVERRSNDLWLGVIYLLNEAVVPVAVSIISNLVTPLIQRKKDKKDPRTPTGGIHTEITIKKVDGYSKIKYDGDGETFLKILNSLKNNSASDEITND